MPKLKISKEQRKAIRDAKRMVDRGMKMDGNEAETRRRVERIFERVMGYKVLKHLSRERAVKGAGETEHVDFAIQLEPGPDARPLVVVELKRFGIDLSKKHLKQVTSYAIDAGCEWILLTNGREWKVYHVEFGQPPKVEILDAWNLLEDDIGELAGKFEMISYRSIRRDGLNKIWRRVKVLAPGSLLAAIVAEDTLKTIRRNLRKNTGILVNNEEVYVGISKLLNEAAVLAMSSLPMPKPTRRRRKRSARDESLQTQSEISKQEKEQLASRQEATSA
jgi:predicted type IV restriction endonuclease